MSPIVGSSSGQVEMGISDEHLPSATEGEGSENTTIGNLKKFTIEGL